MLFKNNKLTFFRNYESYGSYSSSERYKIESLDTILKKFRKSLSTENTVSIKTIFNNINYAVFDLDDNKKLDLFEIISDEDSYVIFQSSEEHYWAILDKPYKKLSDIFNNHNWKICNDQKFTQYCFNTKHIVIRGLYEDKSRKPFIVKKQGELSENFQMFISKLEDFYNKEGFELSVLRYRDPDMLIKYNRKLKMKNLNSVNYER